MKILVLYAGLGAVNMHWKGHDVTAIEYTQDIADVYKMLHPEDTVIVCDAHQYLLDHYQEFDFIWSSPPCQSHSRMIRSGKNRKPRYPDFRLYEEIVILDNDFDGPWVVENVKSWYKALMEPQYIGRHACWSNLDLSGIEDAKQPENFINLTSVAGSEKLKEWLGIHYKGNIYYEGNHCPAQILRNCVHPDIGKQILECALTWITEDKAS